MKTSSRALLIAGITLLVVLLVVAGVAWFRHNYHQVEHRLRLPPAGEAAYNPLYLLKKTLQADGVAVDARQRLALASHPLGEHDTVLLYNDPQVISPAQEDDLLDWVERGGHLILRTPLPGPEEFVYVSVLDELGISVGRKRGCVALRVPGQDNHEEFCRGRRFDLYDVEPELSWGDLKNGYAYARLSYGKGYVDVLADLEIFGNGGNSIGLDVDASKPRTGGLRDIPHQALARQVLAPNYGRGTMHLIYAAEMPSLLRTLLSTYWMAWLPLLLALLAWLWARMCRFGPLLPEPALARRSLLEHVRASGDHVFRHGRGVLLYLAVRQAFFARLRRRDPVAAALAGDAQAELIARRFGLTPAQVRTALQTPSSHERAHFRERIATLIELRNRL